MIAFRLLRLCLHLLLGLSTCALVFPFASAASRAAHIRNWSHKLLAICRVQISIIDRAAGAAASHSLVVANHISWLDIFVINSWQPCHFVAKSDIRDWPLIGWLCDKAGTIFIARGRLRDVRRIYEGLVHGLAAGEHVAFFPEGTTSTQGTVLPFHANLFEAAIEARVPVQPFALRYLQADATANRFHPAVTFIGDTSFVDSLLTILKAQPIRVELIRLPLIKTAGCHRRELAQFTQEAIAHALADQPGRQAA